MNWWRLIHQCEGGFWINVEKMENRNLAPTCKAGCVAGFLFLMATASGCQWQVWAHKGTRCSLFFAYLFCDSPFNKAFSWLMDSISVMMFKPRRGSCSWARHWNHHEGMETLFKWCGKFSKDTNDVLASAGSYHLTSLLGRCGRSMKETKCFSSKFTRWAITKTKCDFKMSEVGGKIHLIRCPLLLRKKINFKEPKL